ncbi:MULTISPECIES: DNA-binding protein [unclassified Variovorax]|uniref:DNA-binding protein n=1 Tax=unclassified Variovorax TaxID=663243 RepID=UPI00076D6BAD|nr:MULTISPECIES: DNA-binding protein [unclassified Variovorax]KWT97664.1 hypothetical protein APY03_1216 [Variovorax sp. WDL1]PNG48762.1 hypothetical protein CHC06_06503 [Variovorax sp. B2]PNG49267.1 hypothetical protein CHC07_06149 [Variovorax sp. B4]VTV18463.1 hypothetical protein WDL1P2_00173 [Variovorax sp. WDL1]
MDPRSSIAPIHPIRSGRGIQEAQVWEAADSLLQEGLRPTIERVRQKIGSGSPNTVSPMLERWFATLGQRLGGRGARLTDSGNPSAATHGNAHQLPLTILQAAEQLWDVARREADQVQIQMSESTRRELELQRTTLAQQEAELLKREVSFEQAHVALDEALASSRQAVTAMEAQMRSQQQEAARLLSASEAELRRLRKGLEEALAGKEAFREKAAMELAVARRDAREAEERHLAHERRLLSDIDRERMAARQASAELAKEQKAHAAHVESAHAASTAAQQALHKATASHNTAVAAWSSRLQEAQVELATLRERAASTELRATDLGALLERLQAQSEHEIAALQDSHAATKAALRRLESQRAGGERSATGRSKGTPK